MQSDFACNLTFACCFELHALTALCQGSIALMLLCHPIEPMKLAFDFGSCNLSNKNQ